MILQLLETVIAGLAIEWSNFSSFVFGEVSFSWLPGLFCISKYLCLRRKKMEAERDLNRELS